MIDYLVLMLLEEGDDPAHVYKFVRSGDPKGFQKGERVINLQDPELGRGEVSLRWEDPTRDDVQVVFEAINAPAWWDEAVLARA